MIAVTAAAPLTTVQDAGRTRHLRLGVPTAGPADRVAAATANALVGNDPDAAVVEAVGLPFGFVPQRLVLVAATGPGVRVVTRDAVPGWTCVLARAGEEVRVEGPARYAYVAVSGGIATRSALGSRAAYADIVDAVVRAGDRLALGPSRVDASRAGLAATPPPERDAPRAVRGPHADRVDAEAFFAATWRVDERSDRMGVRLVGPAVPTRGGELLTCGMVEGAVQVPAGGAPIVLLADHQTTGGYPVVATVIAADLPLVAQASPASAVRFVETSAAEAVAALQRVRRGLDALRRASD